MPWSLPREVPRVERGLRSPGAGDCWVADGWGVPRGVAGAGSASYL